MAPFNDGMKDDLDKQLLALRNQEPPDCHAAIETNVLRKIRQVRRESHQDSLLDWLAGMIPDTNFVLSTIVLAVSVSALATALTAMAMKPDRREDLNRALGFEAITMTNIVNLQRH